MSASRNGWLWCIPGRCRPRCGGGTVNRHSNGGHRRHRRRHKAIVVDCSALFCSTQRRNANSRAREGCGDPTWNASRFENVGPTTTHLTHLTAHGPPPRILTASFHKRLRDLSCSRCSQCYTCNVAWREETESRESLHPPTPPLKKKEIIRNLKINLLAHGLAHALAHDGPSSPSGSILVSPDRPDLLQRLDVLPATVRQRDYDVGCLHLLLEHLLERHRWTERYVAAWTRVTILGLLGIA